MGIIACRVRDIMFDKARRILLTTKTTTKRHAKRIDTEPTLVGEYLVVDPRVCHGKLTFRGTRIPVETVLSHLANGHSIAYLRKRWPEVSAKAIEEAISLASEHLIEHYRGKKS